MAVSQRFDRYSSHHPRITFASGLATGAAAVAGVVLAAAAVTGLADGAKPSMTVSNKPVAVALMTDEQVFNAEQDFRSANGIGSDVGRAASMTDEQVFNAERDFRAVHGIGSDAGRAASMTDEQVFNAEQDFRAVHGIGSDVGRTDSRSGATTTAPTTVQAINPALFYDVAVEVSAALPERPAFDTPIERLIEANRPAVVSLSPTGADGFSRWYEGR